MDEMRTAFITRVLELCDRENMTIYQLASRAGLPKSTLQSALDPQRGNPGLKTMAAIIDGLRVTPKEFFSSELFDL